MNTPITDHAAEHTDAFASPMNAREFARKLELDRAALMEALNSVANRHVIAGSTGDYREGQLDALSACRALSIAAISAARANFPDEN